MAMNSEFEESLQQAIERWKSAFRQYTDLKRAAESTVVRWEWTSGVRYNILPFWFNRHPGRGRILKEIPASQLYYHRYGFDAEERIRIYRMYDERYLTGKGSLQSQIEQNDPIDAAWETFFDHADPVVEIIEYSPPPRIPLEAQQIFYEDGRVVRYTSFRVNGYAPLYAEEGKNPDKFYEWLGYNGRFKTAEQYIYDGALLSTIAGYFELPGVPPSHFQDRFTYDDFGKLQRIDRAYEDGAGQVLYQKRQKGQTFDSIREAATQKLIEAIASRLHDAKIKEKLYCVELSYLRISNQFPPAVIPGVESYRQALIDSDDPDRRFEIFAPILQGKQWFLELTDPDTLEICALLEQEVQKGERWDTATAILRDVATVLTHYDWAGIIDTTADFVVFAIDHELDGHDLAGVLRKSASKQQIAEWKRNGWL